MNHTRHFPIGRHPCGPLDAITDVAGVRVGHVTILQDEPRVARTGVTAVLPTEKPYWDTNVFAGFHRYNGFGEVTGSHWIAETGVLTSPIVMTSSFSLGVARDAVMAHPYRMIGDHMRFHLPVCAETNDFLLNDVLANHVTREHVWDAIDTAASGPVPQGSVGGGTGMICFGFKGGIGTASRVCETPSGRYSVGVLVQTNFGGRAKFRVDGVPVGQFLGEDVAPTPKMTIGGSVVVIVATDAPLIPEQCTRLAQRAVVGLGRMGGYGANTSGDFILAFSTANQFPAQPEVPVRAGEMLPNMHINPLFEGVIEATESAVLNSMLFSPTMTGYRGAVVYGLESEMLENAMSLAREHTRKNTLKSYI